MGELSIISVKKKAFGFIRLFITLVIVAILLFLGTKLYLYLNLAFGNDVMVNLEVDKRDLFLEHGQEEQIAFQASVSTNPFCTALCQEKFTDISRSIIVDSAEFTLRPSIPVKKSYTLQPTQHGEGMDLYRFDMECHGIKTTLCHTAEGRSTRSILVTLRYNLTEQEKRLKELSREQLLQLSGKLGVLKGRYEVIENASARLTSRIIYDAKHVAAKKAVARLEEGMQNLGLVWKSEDYALLADNINSMKDEMDNATVFFDEVETDISVKISSYNRALELMHESEKILNEISNRILTTTVVGNDSSIVREYNEVASFLEKNGELSKKLSESIRIRDKINETVSRAQVRYKIESLTSDIKVDMNYDMLCEITADCIQHPSIESRASQIEFDLRESCRRIDELRNKYHNSTVSLNQSYPEEKDFWNNISATLFNLKQNLTQKYRAALPENKTNSELIKNMLLIKPLLIIANYSEYNLTSALISELIKEQPNNCSFVSLPTVTPISISYLIMPDAQPVPIDVEFPDQKMKCCVFGKCNECCQTEDCINDKTTFPVVFLHGHAVNREVSAEYSLEGFNQIQQKLEQDGYLNTGTITLYSLINESPGLWGMSGVPLTIRASYYFDVFQQPDSYVTVQAKSESIDTYAIRLRDLISIIKYKTGKPKVNLMAFSMGGLVTRRYLQIFGTEDVNKVILIGTPNKGILGKIADFCPITGEKLECRDMNMDSLFMNKLNSGVMPNVPIYNIVGTGCDMNGKNGDGIVLQQNGWLDGAKNFLINGTCVSAVNPLHTTIRNINIYPEVYSVILSALRE